MNLSARLNDLARPSGVVLDGNFALELFAPEQVDQFSPHHVYLRGVAEDSTVEILAQKTSVIIPASAAIPLEEENWQEEKKSFTCEEVRNLTYNWAQILKFPAIVGKLKVEVMFPKPTVKGVSTTAELREITYTAKPKPKVVVKIDPLKRAIPLDLLKDDDKVLLIFSYVRAPK